MPLRSLGVAQTEDLYEHLLTVGRADGIGGLSTKTLVEVRVLLRQILDHAVARGLLPSKPARHALAPRHRRDQHRRRVFARAKQILAEAGV